MYYCLKRVKILTKILSSINGYKKTSYLRVRELKHTRKNKGIRTKP